MKTLSLFNAVIAKVGKAPHVDLESGLVITADAAWATSKIVAYYRDQKLSGNDLNKTFHKSFEKVRNSSRYELAVEQIIHYCSTYGTGFQGEIYIPDEVLEVPDAKMTLKVINGLSKDEIVQKCLELLSGIALKEETINDILSVLDEVGYVFDGKEKIKNREAIIKIADMYGIVPNDTIELFRYCIYKATGESLLIKNGKAIAAIKASNFNPSVLFKQHGLEKLATIFNRFKPLFLAFKTKCPATINAIAKLSKKFHVALPQNALGEATQRRLTNADTHWFDNATPYAFFKAMTAVHSRMTGQREFCYRIRNGKSWTTTGTPTSVSTLTDNFAFMLDYTKTRWSMKGVNIFIPEGVEYAVPTSEKMFVGYIPTGTKFYGEKLAVGIYWENALGANDLDLSSMDIDNNRIGWNSRFSNSSLTFSGDITSAPNGAVEYLHCEAVTQPCIVTNCVFSGEDTAGYKIIIGAGDEVSKPYMMDPNKVVMQVKTQAIQKQMVLGVLLPEQVGQSFVLLNFAMGQARVTRNSNGLKALYEQYRTPLSFRELVTALGAKITDTPEDSLDFSVDKLDKTSFTGLWK